MNATVSRRFPPWHRWDRNFHLAYALLLCAAFVTGFGLDIRLHLARHEPAYPLIVHVHGLVFSAWLAFLLIQVGLIRIRRPDLHRTLGWAGVGLAATMIVLGAATVWVVDRMQPPLPGLDPPVLWLQAADLVAFSGLVGAGILRRRDAGAHKRLMLLGTLFLSDAAFVRFLEEPIHNWLAHPGFWPFFAEVYAPTDLLVLGVGLYDLTTRRRLHPAWLWGAGWILLAQLAALWLYRDPAAGALAGRLLAR